MEFLPILDSFRNDRLMGLCGLDHPLLGRCDGVMKIWHLLGPLFVVLYPSGALAQETLDVGKVTCEQFISGELADTRSISIWLYGYYNGTRKNTVIDILDVQEFEQALIHFCLSNKRMPVSEASNSILGTKK
jgi:HdeA/HdeB family